MVFSRVSCSGVLTVIFLVGMSSARAQQDTGAAVAPSDDTTGVADLARQRLLQGIALFDARDFQAALEAFKASLDLYASPNTHLYVARCHVELQNFVQAYVSYRSSIALAEDRVAGDARYHDTAQAARDELSSVRARIGLVKLDGQGLTEGSTVNLGSQNIPRAAIGLAIPALPGPLVVAVSEPGVPSRTETVQVRAGDTITVVLATIKPRTQATLPVVETNTSEVVSTTPSPTLRRWAYAGWGASAISFGLFATMRILAREKFNEIDARCDPRPCSEAENGAIADGQRLDRIGDYSLVSAFGLALFGTAMWWLQPDATN